MQSEPDTYPDILKNPSAQKCGCCLVSTVEADFPHGGGGEQKWQKQTKPDGGQGGKSQLLYIQWVLTVYFFHFYLFLSSSIQNVFLKNIKYNIYHFNHF